jgi:hypothetical protein
MCSTTIWNILENKESNEVFEDILVVKMESSKLINYSTNMCQSGQGTTILDMYVLEDLPFSNKKKTNVGWVCNWMQQH